MLSSIPFHFTILSTQCQYPFPQQAGHRHSSGAFANKQNKVPPPPIRQGVNVYISFDKTNSSCYHVFVMWRGFIENLSELLYPATCVACGKGLRSAPCANKLVCAQCWGSLKKNIPPFCRSCGRHLERAQFNARICPSCVKKNFYFDRAFSPCVYEGAMKTLIHAFKYAGKDYLGEKLTDPIISFINEYDIPIEYIDMIVPIPLSKTKMREREFNHCIR